MVILPRIRHSHSLKVQQDGRQRQVEDLECYAVGCSCLDWNSAFDHHSVGPFGSIVEALQTASGSNESRP